MIEILTYALALGWRGAGAFGIHQIQTSAKSSGARLNNER
jgi:hypothetical protein